MKISSTNLYSISDLPASRLDFFIGSRWIGRTDGTVDFSLLHALTTNLKDLEKHGLTCANADSSEIVRVDVNEFISQFGSKSDLLRKMYSGIAPGIWQLHAFRARGNQVIADFSIVLPQSMANNPNFRIFCNDIPASDLIIFNEKHFSSIYWYAPLNTVFGFRCVFDINVSSSWMKYTIEFDSQSDDDCKHFREHWNFTDLEMLKDLPDLGRMQRVASKNINPMSFLNGGKTAFERLIQIALKNGIDVQKSTVNVLDWGIGCGRVARHFHTRFNCSITGIDIDSDNIEWCKRNLRGDFRVVPLAPPSGLPSSSFDLIYACSVLSHLTEFDANLWLSEIAELLNPDGIALLSFNGTSNAISYLSRRPADLSSVLDGEIFDKDFNSELTGFIPSNTYYRQVFSTDDWWINTLRHHFQLISVEMSVVSGYQHIAVLRKKVTH